MHTEALGLADPETPTARAEWRAAGRRGLRIGDERHADALGEDVFRRAPVTADLVLPGSSTESGCTIRSLHTSDAAS